MECKDGHSGFDINKNRGNSGIELANCLNKIDDIQICKFKAGSKFNVIPSQSECEFITNRKVENINELIKDFNDRINIKYKNIKISLEHEEESCKKDLLSIDDSKRFLNSIVKFKHGVFFENKNGLVTTSENLGVIDLENNVFKIGVRSSREKEEKEILDYLKNYAQIHNYEFKILGSQPGFETKESSELIRKLKIAHKNSINDNILKINPVHITVESGFFSKKIPNLEVAIISPKIIGAHTTKERVEIKSIYECDMWIYEFLKLVT